MTTSKTPAAMTAPHRRNTEAEWSARSAAGHLLRLVQILRWRVFRRRRLWLLTALFDARLFSHRALNARRLLAIVGKLALDPRDSMVERLEMLVELLIGNVRAAQLMHQRLPRPFVDIVARSLARLIETIDRLAEQGVIVSHHLLARIQRIGGA